MSVKNILLNYFPFHSWFPQLFKILLQKKTLNGDQLSTTKDRTCGLPATDHLFHMLFLTADRLPK